MSLPPELDELENVDWSVAFTTSGLTRHQQTIAARRLARGLEQAEHAEARARELEAEIGRLRTMVAALVDHLAERGNVDMVTLRTRIADALAAPTPPAPPKPYR
ncbi:MAG TPA: hypothetical protein VGH28_25055 [Polyangiaceae bacterium]|jgi:hypothetical protein